MTRYEVGRIMKCPHCGRVSSVAPWIRRPICVHSWDNGTPEIWDADDGEGIEASPNLEWRTPGPSTWSAMVMGVSWMTDGDPVYDDRGGA